MIHILKKIISIKSLDELSAFELAEVIKFLISHEVKPGGPYVFQRTYDNVFINNHIYNLFAEKGKELNPSMISTPIHTVSEFKTNSTIGILQNTKYYDAILNDIRPQLNAEIYGLIENIVQKVKKSDKNGEISELSTVFYNSLKKINQHNFKLSSKLSREYSLANTYTWVTYSLIDDLLDVNYKSSIIPLIMILQRKITYHYMNAGVDIQLTESLFNEVDMANMRELDLRSLVNVNVNKDLVSIYSLNFEKIDYLMSQKSIAHAIGPIRITSSINDLFLNDVERAMHLYCSSRQLNDDLHDWVDDFSAGQITYVVSLLLKASKVSIGNYTYQGLLNEMKEAYWNDILVFCCEKIKNDINDAIALLEKNTLKKDSDFISYFLKPISESAQQALDKHNFEKDFLESMSL